MSGTKAGGKAAAKTNKERYDKEYLEKYGMTFYEYQGSRGGKKGHTCGILSVMAEVKYIKENPQYRVLSSGVILGISGIPKKPQMDAKGYLRVQIRSSKKYNNVSTLKVHRVVAEAFIPNPDNLPQVDHIDGDKSNNDVSNLEWVTNSENMRRAVANCVYDKRLPDSIVKFGGQALTAILDGYVAEDIYRLNDIGKKTFWRAVSNGRITAEVITNLSLGRKYKYCYYDKSRGKWRVERSDSISTGKQFNTEAEAIKYAKEAIAGGFAADRNLARRAGAKGGRISKRPSKTVKT